jgi:hypothetical protein
MNLTIREKIIRELVDVLNGFTWESISAPKVYRGRQIFNPDTELPPIITILPRAEDGAQTDFGTDDKTMLIDAICLERMNGQNPSELGEAILGELTAAVFGKEVDGSDGDPEKFGGMSTTYADAVSYVGGGVDRYPDELGQQILHVGITIRVKYQTNAGDPYNH